MPGHIDLDIRCESHCVNNDKTSMSEQLKISP